MAETITPYNVTERAESSAECDYCEEGSEYGAHYHELYESRMGAAAHTGDELADIFLDAVEAYAAPWRRAEYVPRDVEGWCEDSDDSQVLSDEIQVAEGKLGDAGYCVSWDDGYLIYKVVEVDA